jgi:hypothetical protein
MAELTWNDLLSDAARYPDTMLWTMEDGSQIALGTLRQTVRSGFVPQDHYASAQQRAQEAEQRARYVEAQLVQRLSEPPAPPHSQGEQIPDLYHTDPLFKPLYQLVSSVKDDLAQLRQWQQHTEQRNTHLQQTIQQLPVVMHVQKLQAQDPSLDATRLLEFAREHQIQPHRLDDAYQLMTREQALQRAREEGMAQAKADLAKEPPAVPYAPFGPPQTMPPATPTFENENALEQAILSDPALYNEYTGQA